MRRVLGWALLAVGVVGLGLWGRAGTAPQIEAGIATQAQSDAVIQNMKHAVQVAVSGRDITITGLADTVGEKDRATEALMQIEGRRVVRNELTVLPQPDPFQIAISKSTEGLSVVGAVPSEAFRDELAGDSAMQGAGRLTLSGGAPADWDKAAQAGLAALHQLESGKMELSGQVLSLTGTALNPAAEDRVLVALNTAPTAFEQRPDLTLLDDGRPPAFDIAYATAEGAQLSGKLPRDLDAAVLADALGVQVTSAADLAQSTITDAAPDVLNALAGLKPWLHSVETMNLSVVPDGVSQVQATVPPSVPADQAAQSLTGILAGILAGNLGDAASVQVTTALMPPEGSERVNAASGQSEILHGIYWVPVAAFEAEETSCRAETDSVLSANPISFLSGAADLDARSQRSLNVLASVLRHCVGTADLRFDIEGHTDSTGDAAANLTLSQARADVVMQNLAARGVPAAVMTAQGFGASRPVADNATPEGRAKNRRTEIVFKGP